MDTLILQQAALIERLQGRSFGGSLKDRAVKHEGPSLFEEYDEEARLAAAKELEKASKDVDTAAQKRRDETAQQSKGRGKRPERYNTYGLPETVTTVYPEGVNPDEYDVIGQDETRVLHLQPQRLWVEKIVTPVLRRKTDKNTPTPTSSKRRAHTASLAVVTLEPTFLPHLSTTSSITICPSTVR